MYASRIRSQAPVVVVLLLALTLMIGGTARALYVGLKEVTESSTSCLDAGSQVTCARSFP